MTVRRESDMESQTWRVRRGESDMESQTWRIRCGESDVESQTWRVRRRQPGRLSTASSALRLQ